MLRFQHKPDTVFTKVLDRLFDQVIEDLKDDIEYNVEDSADLHFDDRVKRMFGGSKILLNEVKRLQAAHKAVEVYMPTDYHFLLLDRMLSVYIEVYNDLVQDSVDDPDTDFSFKLNGKPILYLDSGSIMGFYFWDSDYDMKPEVALALKAGALPKRVIADICIEGIKASAGDLVDLQDLRLDKYSDSWEDKTDDDDDYDKDFWFSYEETSTF